MLAVARAAVQQLIYRHLEATESQRAREILADWPRFAGTFWKVVPKAPTAKPLDLKPAEAKPLASVETVIDEKVTASQP